MTVLDSLRAVLHGWLRREDAIQRRLTELRDESIALTSLLRTVEKERTQAEAAVKAAQENRR